MHTKTGMLTHARQSANIVEITANVHTLIRYWAKDVIRTPEESRRIPVSIRELSTHGHPT